MTTAAARAWRNAGKPTRYARPITDLAATLRRRGYTVGTIGNDAHIDANPPEDHTPFSQTGWPIPQPFPYVHALDIMPPRAGSGLPSLADLGAQIVADRQAGVPGASWIKYINWTNAAGACRHESWQPAHAVKMSSDRGHIHISARTDYTNSAVAADYDPVGRVIHRVSPAAPTGAQTAPPFPGRALEYVPGRALMHGEDVRTWQARMRARGWSLSADGLFGPLSADAAQKFQREKGLAVDGVVGPLTWAAAWTAPIT